jgi:hypothetical protein
MSQEMSRWRLAQWIGSGVAAISLSQGSCSNDLGLTPALEVTVAPLTLPGVVDACYSLTVENDANQTVSTRNDICASSFGANGGITYIATCDATDSDGNGSATNTVTLTIDGLYGATNKTSPIADFINPCAAPHAPNGCQLSANCVENADAPITFNLTIMREANQGFFDIGVNFDDIFCSAKVDCKSAAGAPIQLLFNPSTGQRDTTIVSAFACTAGAGAGANTILYRDPLKITCGSTVTTLPSGAGKGNIWSSTNPDPAPSDAIWQYAVFADDESLTCNGEPCNKRFWNIAFGLNPTAFPCTLTTTMSASATAFSNFTTPLATTYPVVSVNVPLTDATGLICHSHKLDGSNGVSTQYTPLASPESFDHSYSTAGFQSNSVSSVLDSLILRLDAGLTASYPGSGTTWSDLSGFSNHATLLNSVGFSSANGGHMNLDGVNDYASVSTLGNLGTSNWSMSFWWKSNGAQSNYTSLMSQNFGSTLVSGGWAFKVKNHANQNVVSFSYMTPSITDVVTSTAPNDDRWHNIALTRQGTTLTFYQDGTATSTHTLPANFSFGAGGPVHIGYTQRDGTYLKGSLATALVYGRTLSSAEIKQNYDAEKARFPNCTGGCGLNGQCTATDTCTCATGWSGPNCGTPNSGSVTSGLLIHLDAGNTASYPGSGNAWYDLTTNAHQASLVNGVAFSSSNGGQFLFDGTNDQANVVSTTPTALRGNKPFTVVGWFKRNGNITSRSTWGFGGDQNLQGFTSWNAGFTNEISLDLWGAATYSSQQTYSDTTWKHCVWTYEGTSFSPSTVSIYVNGVQYTGGSLAVRRGGGTYTPAINANGVVIGKSSIAEAAWGSPVVSVFKIYDRVLSPSEVQSDYDATKWRFQ